MHCKVTARGPKFPKALQATNFLSPGKWAKYTWLNQNGTSMTVSHGFMSRPSDSDIAALAGRWHKHECRHNELIIAHGDTSRDVFFLLEGRARVTMFSEDGKEITYRDIEAGENLPALTGRRAQPALLR